MEQHQEPSLLARLRNVLGNMGDPDIMPVPHDNKQAEGDSLYTEYQQALSGYMASLEQFIPGKSCHPLFYPFAFFYADKSKRKVYTIFYFNNGGSSKTNVIGPRTFPFFLMNVCYMPYAKGDELKRLYHALWNLIYKYPYDHIGSIMNLMKRYSMPYMLFLNSLHLRITASKNIYWSCYSQPQIYQSVLKIPIPQNVPLGLVKQYFSAISYKRSANVYFSPLYEYHTDQIENIISTVAHHSLTAVRYSVARDEFTTHPLTDSPEYLLPKHIPLTTNQTTSIVPVGAASFLSSMCEENLPLLDRFAAFLSSIFSPSESGFTVLLSPQNSEYLKTVLKNILTSHTIAASGDSFSLNQIAKARYLRGLFLEQSEGASAVFIRDLLPSSHNLPILKKLIRGRPISITNNAYPTQHYQNNLHLICVTSKPQKAKELQRQLKATLLDFSMSETAIQASKELSEPDLCWLRTSFLLHGLRLRTYQALGMDVPSQAAKDAPDYLSWEDSLLSFLQDHCNVKPGCFCNTTEVYDRYMQYVAATQNGRIPQVKKRPFNTQLRLLLSKYPNYRTVVYKRNHVSRSQPSLWGYDGLKLPPPFPMVSPTTEEPSKKQLLQEYLSAISQYKVEFKQIISARVALPD